MWCASEGAARRSLHRHFRLGDMRSRISEALALKYPPVAVLLIDAKPERATQLEEGGWGCGAAMLRAATKGRSRNRD